MGRPPLNAECRRRLREYDRSWHIKAILRAIAGFSALIALVLLSYANYLLSQFVGLQTIFWLPVILALVSFVYNAVALSLLPSVGSRRRVRPGWHLVANLLIWCFGLLAMLISFLRTRPFVRLVDYNTYPRMQYKRRSYMECDPDRSNYDSPACSAKENDLKKLCMAGLVFLTLVTFFHFVLFVYDCKAVHRRRRQLRRALAQAGDNHLLYNRNPTEHAAQPHPGSQSSPGSLPPHYTLSAQHVDADNTPKFV